MFNFYPDKTFSRTDVMSRPTPVPAANGIYFWWFKKMAVSSFFNSFIDMQMQYEVLPRFSRSHLIASQIDHDALVIVQGELSKIVQLTLRQRIILAADRASGNLVDFLVTSTPVFLIAGGFVYVLHWDLFDSEGFTMATISSLGLGSGTLTSDLLDKLKAGETSATVTPITNSITKIQKQKTDLSSLIVTASSAKTAAMDLGDESTYLKRTATHFGGFIRLSIFNNQWCFANYLDAHIHQMSDEIKIKALILRCRMVITICL